MEEAAMANVAALIADPARARILRFLIDGTMRPAGELASAANISPQSASAHLAKLVSGGLLAQEAQGRHRYFRLSSAAVAETVESLPSPAVAVRPAVLRTVLPSKDTPIQFLRARTCYDHLAGEMAVRVCEAMLKARWLLLENRDFRVTRSGAQHLAELGIDVDDTRRSRRVFARACVDLTQRRPHIGGALGGALLDLYVDRGWILRSPRSRVVSITRKGREAFEKRFGR
jgi:DNA-binding transcriptional ArsR family regulator